MDSLLDGVDFSLPGNGGLQCKEHVSLRQRIAETSLAVAISLLSLMASRAIGGSVDGEKASGAAVQVRNRTSSSSPHKWSLVRRLLAGSLPLVFGLEVGYKLCTRQAIFLLNPCHVLSTLNIYLLLSSSVDEGRPPPLKIHKWLLHTLHGPLLAILFPVTNTLKQPFERETYWIQHLLIVFSPVYMYLAVSASSSSSSPLSSAAGWGDQKQTTTTTPVRQMVSDLLRSYAIWVMYHFGVMHWVGVWTMVNVGSMLCPAISDPFGGSYYRLHGLWHQFTCIALMGLFEAMLIRIQRSKKRDEPKQD